MKEITGATYSYAPTQGTAARVVPKISVVTLYIASARRSVPIPIKPDPAEIAPSSEFSVEFTKWQSATDIKLESKVSSEP